MNILLTGATGYIGNRLLPVLTGEGHQVTCVVRDKARFDEKHAQQNNIGSIELDLLEPAGASFPAETDAAYFLIHSMSSTSDDFEDLEEKIARNFLRLIGKTHCRQIIFLSGLINDEELSKHLRSRKRTEEILGSGTIPLTVLRAGIIVGSGSASFEIIRDLVEKLPVMVAPKWLNTLCQPIGVTDVISILISVAGDERFFDQVYDIGGEDILTYKEMLLKYAEVRGLNRKIWVIPFMTPRLSSYWLYFITSVSYRLAVNLVESMKVKVVCRDRRLIELLGMKTLSYKDSVRMALERIKRNNDK